MSSVASNTTQTISTDGNPSDRHNRITWRGVLMISVDRFSADAIRTVFPVITKVAAT